MTHRETLTHLIELETQLHKIEIRRDSRKLGELLHAEFEEIGRSGRRYSRNEILAEFSGGAESAELATIHAQDFALAVPANDVALLTYTSAHVAPSGRLDRWSRRSSLWMKTEQGWKLRFHQGTPAESQKGSERDWTP